MVGIDVLDVPGTVDADAGGQVDCMMLDTELAGSGRERRAAIGAQDQVGRHEGLQGLRQGGGIRGLEHTIRRYAGSVARHKNRYLLVRETALGGLATAFARLPWQGALPLEREQEHRFVHLRNSDQGRRHRRLRTGQETMTPAMCRSDMDAEFLCHSAQRTSITQRFGLPQPVLTLMQSGEWRAAQGIERPPTLDTTIALQTIRLTVPTHALGSAMRTQRSGRTATLDDCRRSRASLQCGHLDSNSFQLAWRQLPQQGHDSLHVRLAHFDLLDKSAHRRHDTQYPLRQAHYVSHSTDFANRAKKIPDVKEVKTYKADPDAFSALKAKKIDAWISDKFTVMETLSKNPDAGIVTGEQVFVERVSLIMHKNNKEFMEKVNQALADLTKDGTLKSISEKYFKSDITCK